MKMDSETSSASTHEGVLDHGLETEFETPGPGQWNLDRSHFPGGTTPIMQSVLREAMENAFSKQWVLHGIPAETMSVAFVQGFMYTRLRPLVLADRPSTKPPPLLFLTSTYIRVPQTYKSSRKNTS